MADEKDTKNQVKKPIDGCVVNWEKHIQVNPKTGDTYDFNGVLMKKDKDKDKEK